MYKLLGASFFAVFCLSANLPLLASSKAEQGTYKGNDERVYIVKPDAPVTISTTKELQPTVTTDSAAVLKDPSFTFKKKRPKTKKTKAVKPKPVVKKSELVFKKLPVQGHVRQPRVNFKSQRLPIATADQGVEADFINKVYEPLDDPNF